MKKSSASPSFSLASLRDAIHSITLTTQKTSTWVRGRVFIFILAISFIKVFEVRGKGVNRSTLWNERGKGERNFLPKKFLSPFPLFIQQNRALRLFHRLFFLYMWEFCRCNRTDLRWVSLFL